MIGSEERAYLRDHIREALAIGEDDFDTIVAGSVDLLDDPEDEEVADTAARIAMEEFPAYLAEQESWPDVLDADRLIRAFRELEMAGIVARENFTCCRTCGTAEIGGEVPEGAAARGYAFCHHQDVQRAVAGQGVYLSYGVFAEDASGTAAIGEEIVAALRRHGLAPVWNGDPAKRIEVPMTWRRRRFGRLAAWPGAPEAVTAGPLRVTYCDYRRRRRQDDAVPMSLGECRRTLLDLTPWKGNFATFEVASGDIVQMMWEAGPRLWLESPDGAARCSRGRHVTPPEAEEIITLLADRGRADLTPLGEIEVRPWSDG